MNIKSIRIARGLSQKELANLTNINIATISAYETNSVDPPISKIIKIAKALKVTVNDLINENEDYSYLMTKEDYDQLIKLIKKISKKETIKTNDFKQRVDRKRKTQSLNGITQHNEVKEINNNQGKIVIGINNEDNNN